MRKLSLFCALLLAICLVSCDLLTGPKDDIYKSISDAADWANAPKLAVRIEFPAKWGVSSPAQGDITPAMDIRRGYEFSVEFTPDVMYSLQSWMVFRTEDLDKLSSAARWVENPESINDPNYIQPLGSNEVTLRDFNASARVFKFTINTTDPVTLVPCCGTEPRITRTEPRNSPNGQPYSIASDITLYFNGALDDKDESFRFAESETDDGIWITAKTPKGDGSFTITNNNDKDWYSDPVYKSVGGFFTVTMKTGAVLPPEESLMTVTVRGIKNAQGNPMAAAYSFSWNTSHAVDVNFTSYSATYNDNENKIEVILNQTGADKVVTYYRMDNGNDIPLITFNEDDSSLTSPLTVNIERVPVINDSGIRQGRQITGIAEYEIFIELYVDEILGRRTSFKIWNFPGMSVAHNNPVTEIKTADDLIAINDNLGGQYVLAKDISITSAWTPIGTTNTSPFTGKFYGNGRIITFTENGSIGGTTDYRGLFGYAAGTSASQQALIRDLTFEYNGPVINLEPSYSNDLFIGGVAGYLKDTTIRNIITLGVTFDINADSNVSGIIRFGGITGYIEGSGKIENCRATLSIGYTSSGHTKETRIGAIAGETGMGSEANTITITNGYTFGNSALGPDVTLTRLIIDGVTVAANVSADKKSFEGQIIIGGAVGQNGQDKQGYGNRTTGKNTVNDITFTAGTVSFSGNCSSDNTSYYKYCGGIAGRLEDANIVGSSFSGNIETINDVGVNGNIIYSGGLAGYVYIDTD